MSAILCAPSFVAGAAALELERHDISFHSPKPGLLAVDVTLTNRGAQPTIPTIVRFQSAPLGAFVDWRPLAEVVVPAIVPGARQRISFEVDRPRARTLGDPAKIPPARFLTALGMGEPEPSHDRQLLRTSRSDSLQSTIGFQTAPLSSDIFELLGRGNPHWAGNLNVFVAEQAVERHLASALRIYPGRTNLAFFVVGSGCDGYSFQLHGSDPRWECALYNPAANLGAASLLTSVNETSLVEESKWIEIVRQTFMLLAIRPPARTSAGNVEVRITQRSSGRTAAVEFDLDPGAAGPGCFVVG